MVCCLLGAGILLLERQQEDRRQEELLDNYRNTSENPVLSEVDTNSTETAEAEQTVTGDFEANPSLSPEAETTDSAATIVRIPNPYKESFLANEDMAGWLVIPGTNIDYPVMWTPRDENYYLYRDFDHSENQNGSLILDTDSNLNPLTTNLIIHGHNMRSGAMFGNLTDYENKDFYKDHKIITLYTEECQRNYEVIATFRSQVYRKSDQVFKFYKFFQANTREEFDDFYNNIKEMAQYDTGVTAEYGDRFITLSTCVYHVENGRFVVVAKEIEAGDYYEPIHSETENTNQQEDNT